ncbi:NADH dehydrogenase [ubiquinone] complex assembly factor 7 [Chlorella sorokiniana]|uniref:type II protein arginine methyltransferase n=1 Tax=Chlorella sorokiniana TaxID=3076 RepID=A0A2P6TWT0_CHLSO|nr:NADH dehydrogenase [ubiquinone] complex assembly factor 7 [Chlorella sorokiniana]|eukprot:PRW58511.1 NADH dehydrogenase [ubiquinone] complex assembly factor 7 [Chlorella sorokiniana]
MLLPSALRGLRAAQGGGVTSFIGAAWRGLAGATGGGAAASSGGSGGSEDTAAAVSPSSADPPPQQSAVQAEALQEHIISVDRSGLINPAPHSHDPAVLAAQAAAAGVVKEPETPLGRHLRTSIQFGGGPITLAEYIGEVLTNPQHGYYTQRDVFGVAGDFVTSPEISQMFGEMVGIWCVAAWQQLGCPEQLHIVELGPGRGTLMADLLRGTAAFQQFSQALRVSMVEVSPVLRRMQWEALRCQGPLPPADETPAPAPSSSSDQQQLASSSSSEAASSRGGGDAGSSSSSSSSSSSPPAIRSTSDWNGAAVSWHRSLDEVQPEGPTLYIAHEFFDALPVHQFQRTERGWCERLIDVASPDSPLHLRMVLSPGATPAARVLLPRRLRQLDLADQQRLQALEVCPQGMALAESLAQRVAQHGGAALIIDYGQDGPYETSLQAIRQHEFVGLLEQPGSADLSSRVDYSALRASVEDTGAAADCLGPIPQAAFLLGLGIDARLEQLLANATPEQAKVLEAGFRRLVGGTVPGVALTEEGMGVSYQAFCIAQRGLAPWPFGAVEEAESEDGGEGGAEQDPEQQQPEGQQQQQQAADGSTPQPQQAAGSSTQQHQQTPAERRE